MMLTAGFPAELHKTISNAWLDGEAAPAGDTTYGVDGAGRHYVDCHKRYVVSMGVGSEIDMSPRGISIESGNAPGQTFAVVHGHLWDENAASNDNHPVPIGGLMHSVRFKRIYAEGTTARGIRIYG
jgi:hypothetical protein